MKYYKVLIQSFHQAAWLPVQADNATLAATEAFEKCEDTGFVPQPATLLEITPEEYHTLEKFPQ
jgi:hypothetical protein